MSNWSTEKEFIDPVKELEWKTEGVLPPGACEAVFYRDNESGTYIRLLELKPGLGVGAKEPFGHEFDEFVFIISGGLINERLGHRYKAGSFAVFPAGTKHGPLCAPVGARVIEFRHYFSEASKQEKSITTEIEFKDALSTLDWKPTAQHPGALGAIAYCNQNSGSYIRFHQLEPGFGEGQEVCCKHQNFDEIIYLVSGGLYNRRLDFKYETGYIGLMPCGIAHGPMEAPVGAYLIEFRHVIKKNDGTNESNGCCSL